MKRLATTRGQSWDSRELSELLFHDQIFFHAIKEYLRVQDRKLSPAADKVLNHLIRAGLIEKDTSHMSEPFQQILRYSAILASRMTDHNYRLERNVSVNSSLFGNESRVNT